jgi:hypothetical protein
MRGASAPGPDRIPGTTPSPLQGVPEAALRGTSEGPPSPNRDRSSGSSVGYSARVEALPRDLHAGAIGATPDSTMGAPWPRTSTAVMGIVATQLVDVRNVVARSMGLTPGGSFTLGTADDFRVPDLGFHRDPTPHSYYPTAALVIEIMSPRDETRAGGALAPSVTAWREPDAAARCAGPSPAWQLGGARSGDCTVGSRLWPRIRTCRRG